MRSPLLISLLACALGVPALHAQEVRSLAGCWRVRLDPADRGERERWFAAELGGGRSIALPGTTDGAGLGYPLEHATMRYPVAVPASRFPSAAEPERADQAGHLVREHLFVGKAWYQRALEIPPRWAGKYLRLRLERTLWRTAVWIDERALKSPSADSLVAPHEYELGFLAPGRHRLSIQVDNGMIHNIATIGHAYGPETQSRWNGLVGKLELIATGPLFLDAIAVHPGADRRSVHLHFFVRRRGDQAPRRALVRARILPAGGGPPLGSARRELALDPRGGAFELLVPLAGAAQPWDEFHPIRYRAELSLEAGDGAQKTWRDSASALFGFRSIERSGRHILVNGRRTFLRGTLDCCVYPASGHPPMDVAEWKRVLGTIKRYGFNHVRYHTWCPPEAAFEAADQLGLYLAPETPLWIDDWTKSTFSHPRAPGRDPRVLEFIRREIERICRRYGNHPSFALLVLGNEFGMSSDWEAIEQLLAEARRRDPRRLYCATTARKRCPSDQFRVTHRCGRAATRGIGPAHTEWDFAAAAAATDLPLIAHETGQRPVFPDVAALLASFTGPLQPYNLLRQRAELAQRGLLGQVADFQRASARFQLVQYKAEHEAMARTAEYAGYQLLMLNDFTGQSEALVGILDPFWQSKGVVGPAEVRRWNAPTVALARFARFTWRSDEIFRARLEVAHYGPRDLDGALARWSLASAAGQRLGAGRLGPLDMAAGGLRELGAIAVPLGSLQRASALTLAVSIGAASNRWTIWVYPPPAAAAAAEAEEQGAGPLLARRFDEPVERELAAGRSVLLEAHGLKNPSCARTRFASVYWSAGWWGNRFSSLGILCDPNHPALADFPTADHGDWQWYELLEGATTFDLSALPRGLRPIVQPVPDFHHNRLLGQVFEARVGAGKLLVCGYDLHSDLGRRHAARQLRRSLLRYMAGAAFAPRFELAPERARALLGPPLMQRLGARVVSRDAEVRGYEAARAIDGDPITFWHTPWNGATPPFPHELVIALERPLKIAGLRLLARQDGNPGGRIRGFEIYLGASAEGWGEPLARGELPDGLAPHEIHFAPIATRFIRFVATSSHEGHAWASLAELELIPAKE